MNAKVTTGIGGHIAAFNNCSKATGQRQFDPPHAVKIRNFHSLVTWLGNRRSTRRNPQKKEPLMRRLQSI
jgi:hypothetical protein